MPVLNGAATVEEQLRALLGQRRDSDWCVVVADNGSSDGTQEVVRELALSDERLRLLDVSDRRGAAAARNLAVLRTSSEYVLFCDSDDVVGVDWIPQMRGALSRSAIVAGRLDGTRLNPVRRQRWRHIPQTDGLQHAAAPEGLMSASAQNLGIRRDLFASLRGFDERYVTYEDSDLCVRAQLAGESIAFVPGAVVHLRVRGTLTSGLRQAYRYGRGRRTLATAYGSGDPGRERFWSRVLRTVRPLLGAAKVSVLDREGAASALWFAVFTWGCEFGSVFPGATSRGDGRVGSRKQA
ncbi:glycosyltransferase [Xylanimonas protaetiae]|uniref:glycosyltransferase n=1 Tax=Xylanimonas protaetiae TaxID=2509457 RepID=UPI0013EC6503|nr:glycosyltransferase [Xylanimonas protaetiae]